MLRNFQNKIQLSDSKRQYPRHWRKYALLVFDFENYRFASKNKAKISQLHFGRKWGIMTDKSLTGYVMIIIFKGGYRRGKGYVDGGGDGRDCKCCDLKSYVWRKRKIRISRLRFLRDLIGSGISFMTFTASVNIRSIQAQNARKLIFLSSKIDDCLFFFKSAFRTKQNSGF